LCINVSRYLPKEKEETNFLYMVKGISAKCMKGTKEETNPRASRSLFGRVTLREGEQYLLMNM